MSVFVVDASVPVVVAAVVLVSVFVVDVSVAVVVDTVVLPPEVVCKSTQYDHTDNRRDPVHCPEKVGEGGKVVR